MNITIPCIIPGQPGIGSYTISEDTIASCKSAMLADEFLRNNNQEGEKPMCYKCKSAAFDVTSVIATSAPVPVEVTQRDFANTRVTQIREKHVEKLREQFFVDADLAPQTARDLIKAIKEDAFSLDEKKLARMEDELHYYGPFTGIVWGKNKPDTKGYDAAVQALKDEAQEVVETITLGTIEEGRQALNAFKAWTYEGLH